MKKLLLGFALIASLQAFAQTNNFKWVLQSTYTAAGTDTYTATVPGLTSYGLGLEVKVLFTNSNAGSSTINFSSLGAITLKKNGATNLAGGDIPAGATLVLSYDGTNFQVLGLGGSGGGGVPTSRSLTINGTAGNITSSAGAQDLTADRTWTLNLATAGTAGTYKSVTTDAFGRVTAGTNPTTLSGYGITDAWSAASGVTLTGNNTITQAGFDINFLNGDILSGPTGAVITASTRLDVRGVDDAGGFIFRAANQSNATRLTLTGAGAFVQDVGSWTVNTISGIASLIVGSSAHIQLGSQFGNGLHMRNTLDVSTYQTATNVTLSGYSMSTNSPAVRLSSYITNSATSGNITMVSMQNKNATSLFSWASGTAIGRVLSIDPTYNITGGTSTVYGIDYNPINTSLIGVTHIALRSTSGDWQMQGSATTLTLGGGATASELRFLMPSGGFYTAFRAVTQAANLTYALPAAYPGVSGYILSATTSGVMSWVAAGGGAGALSALTAATGSNTINNVANEQVWQWNSLVGTSTGGLTLTSNSTALSSSTRGILNVDFTGTQAGQASYAAHITNTRVSTGGANTALRLNSTGADFNYAITIDAGDIVFPASPGAFRVGVTAGKVLNLAGVTSGVNEVTITNAATGNNPVIGATGNNTNIGIELLPKGTGAVILTGQLKLNNYTTTTSFTGTAVGVLQYDAAGNILTGTLGGGTAYYAPTTLVANATDANFTATVNGVHNILDGVASANRVITIPTGSNGDVLEFYNTEDTYTWSFTGATVYLADRTTVQAALLYNVPCFMQKIDGLWIIKN